MLLHRLRQRLRRSRSQPEPPLRAFERRVRRHALTIICLACLIGGTAIMVHFSRLDQIVSTQGEMALFGSNIQKYKARMGRWKLTENLANVEALVPESLNGGDMNIGAQLHHAWDGQVKVRSVPRHGRAYEITYEGIPSHACLPLLEWAVAVPLFRQVVLNGIVVNDDEGLDGVIVPFDPVLTAQRCTGPQHVLGLRVWQANPLPAQ